MLGLTFNNIHSSAQGVYWRSGDRSLLPAKRVVRYEVPGRDGYYESNEGTYDNRLISGTISFLGTDRDYPTLRAKARLVAQWLAGEGPLVFDDEPDKAYTAKVIDGVSLEQLVRSGSCEVTFDCAPFAESIEYNQQTAHSVPLPHTEVVTVEGSQETDCLIYITARGSITNLTVTRLKVN